MKRLIDAQMGDDATSGKENRLRVKV